MKKQDESSNGFTILHTKKVFYFNNPRIDDIDIEDIAHSLSQICRFTGHTNAFYSVAQHSVLVARHCSPANEFWGLLHDSAEAYINDLSSPLKGLIGPEYKMIEKTILHIICLKYGLPPEMPREVKQVDREMTINELHNFIDPEFEVPGDHTFFKIRPWGPKLAKKTFLNYFNTASWIRSIYGF